MNFCNFAKVLIARSSKDLESIRWWNAQLDSPTDPPKTTKNKDSTDDNNEQRLTNNITMKDRYFNYCTFTEKYPKMHLDFEQFRSKSSKLQDYLTNKKYWMEIENKQVFMEYFSLKKWVALTEMERLQHRLTDCTTCTTEHFDISSCHKSCDINIATANELYQQGTQNLIGPSTSTSNTTTTGVKVLKSIVKIVQPIVEQQLNVKFPRQMADAIMTSPPVTPRDLNAQKKKVMRESRKQINESLADKGNDVYQLLSSSISFREHDRVRMGNFFESKESAKERVQKSIEKETSGKVKRKQHHGNFESYDFNKEQFLEELRSKPEGQPVNWTSLARKYDVKCNNKFPSNAGQILYEFAKANKIDINKFQPQSWKNHQDYFKRIRRAKKTIIINSSKISLPTPRQSNHLKQDIKTKLASGELYIGEKIAHKDLTTSSIENGKSTQHTTKIYSRKFPLTYLRKKSLDDQVTLGVLRYHTDEDYDQLTDEDLQTHYSRIGETIPNLPREQKIDYIKTIERTRHLKVWHDHSVILNHSHVCFTISWIYDPANFLTDQEFQEKYPDCKPINVQSVVERPYLYIFGQSGSSDLEQTSYTLTRLEDLATIAQPVISEDGHVVNDVMRMFSGDGPARQFEAGQQRGGNYPCICGVPASDHGNLVRCFGTAPLSLDERVDIIKSPRLEEQLRVGNLNPFQGLKKDELIEELERRNVDTDDLKRPELLDELNTILHGICRPPALLTTPPVRTTEEINLAKYEVVGMEPLHDLSNIIQNIIQELPSHINNKQLQKQLENFSKLTIGDKKQIKGSDARLYLVKLSNFLSNSENVDPNIQQMIDSLMDMTNIAYSKHSTRTPKQILRLYNQSFLFAVLCRRVIGVPTKLNARRFFGSHFHSATVHLPEVQRIVNIRSLVTEQEERCFGTLRRISETTTNRQPTTVCDNTVLRFNCQQANKPDSFSIQESTIQKLAKQIGPKPRSVIPSSLLELQPVLVQSHLQRIPDFLLPGRDIWWHMEGNNIIFHDGPEDPSFHQEGPELSHFRSATIKSVHQQLRETWKAITEKYIDNTISLPLRRIKTFDESGKALYIQPNETHEDNNNDTCTSTSDDTVLASNDAVAEHAEPARTDTLPPPTKSPINDHATDIDSIPTHVMNDEEILKKRRLDEDVKRQYKSFIKVMKWSQPRELKRKHYPLEVNVIISKNLPTQNNDKENRKDHLNETSARGLPCKRKLFMPTEENTDTNPPKTISDHIHDIVGDTPEYEKYTKYRRMSKNNPFDKSICQQYERFETLIQLQVSKCQTELRKKTNPTSRETQQKKMAESLLRKWKMYFCK